MTVPQGRVGPAFCFAAQGRQCRIEVDGLVELKANERIDDLVTYDLKIIQSSDVFSFSLDAVLLARFCAVPASGRILDLCTGNGVIPLLLSTRTRAAITGIEIQPRLWDMAVRGVRMNGLEERIRILLGDLRELPASEPPESYDLVTVNPPYLPLPTGQVNANEHYAWARHEVMCTLEDVVRVAGRLLRTGGKMAMVHRPSRTAEIVETLRRHRLEPKRLRFVHPRAGMEANMLLVEAMKGGKPDLRVLPPLIVYREDNRYCDELLEIYEGRKSELGGGREEGE